jgi:branched-chain amino acid transport system substrate-binding protein
LLIGVAVVAGCGSSDDQPGARIKGRAVTVYVAVALHGASSDSGLAIVRGAQLALQAIHARIGRYRIVLKQLDDSTPTRAGGDPGQTLDNARLAVADPTTVGYIGDQDSGASAISIPVLNRVGIAQISPTSTAVGLTSAGPGAAPGEPDKYYPVGSRTFARVAPSDAVQAAVQVKLQRSFGCTRPYVVDDGEVDGEDVATSFDLAARAAGLQVTATQEFDPRATDYRALAANIASTGADCVLVTALTDSNAVALTSQLARALPAVRMFATGGLADNAYADRLPPAIAARVLVTSPALGASAYPPTGQAFLREYARRYGAAEPAAILGYEAMGLMLDAIGRATAQGHRAADRAKVVRALLRTRERRSVLGTYNINSDGDTTAGRYGVWTLSRGRLQFWEALDG